VIVVDFDEIIVPRLQKTYSAMIAHVDITLNRTSSDHTYTFRNAYFFTNQTAGIVFRTNTQTNDMVVVR